MTYTLDQLNQMTPDEVRRAVAQAEGWTNIFPYEVPFPWWGNHPDVKGRIEVPDYPNDANEWVKLVCRVNADKKVYLDVDSDKVLLGRFSDFELIFDHDGTPQSIGLAVCRAYLWYMQEGK